MDRRGIFLGVLFVVVGCGGATRDRAAIPDPRRGPGAGAFGDAGVSVRGAPDASASGGGGTIASGVGGAVPVRAEAGGTDGSSGSGGGGAPGGAGALTCPAGTSFWNVTPQPGGVPVPSGPGCYAPCDETSRCPDGTLCADVPGCMCPDATDCEACFTRWYCVPSELLSCDDLNAYAARTLDEARQTACATNSDCVAVQDSTDCAGSCGVAVNRESAAAVEKAVTRANGAWCNAAMSRGCPRPTPECVLWDPPLCSSGQCVLRVVSGRYVFDIVNPIDSGEFVVVTQSDSATDTCVAALFFVTAPSETPRFEGAYARRGAQACCPIQAYADISRCTSSVEPCDWSTGAVPSTATVSASLGDGYKLTLDYRLYFADLDETFTMQAANLDLDRAACTTQ